MAVLVSVLVLAAVVVLLVVWSRELVCGCGCCLSCGAVGLFALSVGCGGVRVFMSGAIVVLLVASVGLCVTASICQRSRCVDHLIPTSMNTLVGSASVERGQPSLDRFQPVVNVQRLHQLALLLPPVVGGQQTVDARRVDGGYGGLSGGGGWWQWSNGERKGECGMCDR